MLHGVTRVSERDRVSSAIQSAELGHVCARSDMCHMSHVVHRVIDMSSGSDTVVCDVTLF